MKNLAIVICVLTLGITITFSQTIPCSNFAITGSYPDSLNPNDYQITINFNAGQNDFVDYPHVSTVLDCNGDTVATGGLFYFGQFGQTTQDYPVTTIDTTTWWCEPLTAVFIYGQGFLGEIDTCLFSFQNSSISDISESYQISIYPNPSSGILNVFAPNEMYSSPFQIINQVGQVLTEGKINSKNQKIDVNSLSSGFYSLRISGNLPQSVSFIKE
jgi:hypothetical protein